MDNVLSSILLIILVTNPIVSCSRHVKQYPCQYIVSHGDTVVIKNMCFAKDHTIGRQYCNSKTQSVPAMFRIYKDPMYKSECDAIILGKAVKLVTVTGNRSCAVTLPDSVVKCLPMKSALGTFGIRVLDKHGLADGSPLGARDAYVKFRAASGSPQPSADCNDGPSNYSIKSTHPLSCAKDKAGSKANYGFFISKIDTV